MAEHPCQSAPSTDACMRTHMEGTALRLADALSASNKCSADWCREHYKLGNIDILFVPIGGGDVLDVPQASKLAVKLEAKLIIPMHYGTQALASFLKEEGIKEVEPVEKLTIKKKDLELMEGEIVVLEA